MDEGEYSLPGTLKGFNLPFPDNYEVVEHE